MAYFAGVDLGATNLRAVVTDGEGDATRSDDVGTARRSTPQGPTGDAVASGVLAVLGAACADAGLAPADLAAVGVATVGELDAAAGVVRNPSNLPDSVDRIPLRVPLADALDGGQVRLLNDATAGVVAERTFADAPDDVVYLTLSTGIGAGAAVDGHVLAGRDGNAGEVGHLTLDPDGLRTCGCGRPGHWEAYCGGDAIPAYARLLHDDDSAWRWTDGGAGVPTDLPLDDPEFAAADVFPRAGEDPLADAVVEHVARWNALGVADLVHAYAPSAVVIGGPVALENEELVVEPIREHLPDAVFGAVPEVRLTALGEQAVVRGALASVLPGTAADTGDGIH